MELEITYENRGELEKSMQEEVAKLLNEITDFIFAESQKNIVKNNSFGVTGDLFGNVNVDKTQPLQKSIAYMAPWADFVCYGTSPHNVPPHVLDEWCRVKFGLSPEEARRVAFLVARKIARDGIDEKPFLRPAIETARARYGETI